MALQYVLHVVMPSQQKILTCKTSGVRRSPPMRWADVSDISFMLLSYQQPGTRDRNSWREQKSLGVLLFLPLPQNQSLNEMKWQRIRTNKSEILTSCA